MAESVAGVDDRASLLVIGAAAFLVQANARVVDVMLNVIAQEFHTVPEQASIAVSSYALPYGLFQLFYGPIGDRVGKLRVITFCLTFFAVGNFACGFVPNLGVFALLRFLTGVAAAAVIPMSLSYIGDKFPYATRQIALGRFMSAVMMGQIFASTLGGVFGQYQNLGWRKLFFALGAGALVVSAVLLRESRRVPEQRRPERKLKASFLTAPIGGSIVFAGMIGLGPSIVEIVLLLAGGALLLYSLATQYGYLLKRPKAPVVLVTVLIEGIFVFGGLTYLASSLSKRFGVSTILAGLMVGGFGIGGLIYSATVKKLVARIGDLGIFLLGGMLLAFAYVAIGLMPNWQSFLPLVIVLGMGFYTMHSTLQTRATEIAPEARGTAISLFAFMFFMGQSIGPIALGRLVALHSYSAAFVAAGIGLFILAFVSRFFFSRATAVSSRPA